MKLKDDLVLRQIVDQYFIMPIGRLSQICQIMNISSSAAFIWKVMKEGEFTEDMLVKRALEEYTDVSEEMLRTDIHNFIELLDNNFMLDSGRPEPIIGTARIQLSEKQMKNLKEQENHG